MQMIISSYISAFLISCLINKKGKNFDKIIFALAYGTVTIRIGYIVEVISTL